MKNDYLMLKMLEEVPDADLVIKKLDLSSLESVRECAKDVNENESRLDILVNNAGDNAYHYNNQVFSRLISVCCKTIKMTLKVAYD